MRDVLLLSNADFSKILFVNRAYEAIWGRTVESLYENPRSWLEGIHPDERKHVQEAVQRLVDGESLENLECRVVRPDGSISWVRLRAEPVRDSSGHPRRIAGCIHEFTKRKLAEEQVKQAEKQLRLVLDTTPVEISDRGHGLFASKSGEKLGFKVGVGISSMQERIKMIGGRLQIDSSSGGTTVRVTIPPPFASQ